MKRTTTPSIFLAATILMLGTIMLSACSKNNNDAPSAVSEEEAAEVVTQSVSATSGGLAVQATDAAVIADMYTANCGLTKDTVITRTNLQGAVVTYNATGHWHWTYTCSPSARFDYTFAGAVSYDAPRMSSNDSLSSTLSLTGLESSAAAYVLNIHTVRKGSQASKILNKNTFTSTITFSATDIVIDKVTQRIVSGTSSVIISGAGSNGRNFQYSGTLVFTGNQTGTLTLGSGRTYNIQW